jgi:hypothetical protein
MQIERRIPRVDQAPIHRWRSDRVPSRRRLAALDDAALLQLRREPTDPARARLDRPHEIDAAARRRRQLADPRLEHARGHRLGLARIVEHRRIDGEHRMVLRCRRRWRR